ncbi:uncharacterized protein MONBRDRAFT_25876 [Monosiga brevicollis MX1]|uniref:DH domain-containing protein n=1 Tax=Monosiga brevicollis TaxID=81824 RepID=A9V0R0_MONBE|nr:uncharacterized protein MONBRDRAFT_25876 [Monosiga brevicollis MX1]EDQ88796.1 predicted protein [Monosiga brevicollis MX1]|eukprot:XP_001746409.1 hypothetical protein [Monosiga brevicollis MX1]
MAHLLPNDHRIEQKLLCAQLVCECFQLDDQGEREHWQPIADQLVVAKIYLLKFAPLTIQLRNEHGKPIRRRMGQCYRLQLQTAQHGELLRDLALAEPGVLLEMASQIFVLYRQQRQHRILGLNFISAPDANEFMLCVAAAYQDQEAHIQELNRRPASTLSSTPVSSPAAAAKAVTPDTRLQPARPHRKSITLKQTIDPATLSAGPGPATTPNSQPGTDAVQIAWIARANAPSHDQPDADAPLAGSWSDLEWVTARGRLDDPIALIRNSELALSLQAHDLRNACVGQHGEHADVVLLAVLHKGLLAIKLPSTIAAARLATHLLELMLEQEFGSIKGTQQLRDALVDAIQETLDEYQDLERHFGMTQLQHTSDAYLLQHREQLLLQLHRLQMFTTVIPDLASDRPVGVQHVLAGLTPSTRAQLPPTWASTIPAVYYVSVRTEFSRASGGSSVTPSASRRDSIGSNASSPHQSARLRRKATVKLQNHVRVALPGEGYTTLHRANCVRGADVLQSACRKRNMVPADLLLLVTERGRERWFPLDEVVTDAHEEFRLAVRATRRLVLKKTQPDETLGFRLGRKDKLLKMIAAARAEHTESADTDLASGPLGLDEGTVATYPDDGVFVVAVEATSRAALRGLEVGDQLLRVDERSAVAKELKQIILGLKARQEIMMDMKCSRRTKHEVVDDEAHQGLDALIDEHVVLAPAVLADELEGGFDRGSNHVDLKSNIASSSQAQMGAGETLHARIDSWVVPPPPQLASNSPSRSNSHPRHGNSPGMGDGASLPGDGRLGLDTLGHGDAGSRPGASTPTPPAMSTEDIMAANESHSGLDFVRQVTDFVRSADEVSKLMKQLTVEDAALLSPRRDRGDAENDHTARSKGRPTSEHVESPGGSEVGSDLVPMTEPPHGVHTGANERSSAIPRHEPNRGSGSSRHSSVSDAGSEDGASPRAMVRRRSSRRSSRTERSQHEARCIQHDVLSDLDRKRRRKRDKLQATIQELIDTERSYVADLYLVQSRYIAPLMKETILTRDEKAVVLGNLSQLLACQSELLSQLEAATAELLEAAADENAVLRSKVTERCAAKVAQVFEDNLDQFRVYARYCSGHARAAQIVADRKRHELQALLAARNPSQEQATSFASYLIKPVQRVLKYPLLLREMASHLDYDRATQKHVQEALSGLTRLASHINDMTRLTEIFEHEININVPGLVLSQSFHQLMYHSGMTWCNCVDDRGKPRRHVPVYLFVFRTMVVMLELLDSESRGGKRKALPTAFTLPKYRFLDCFELADVIVAGNIPQEFLGVTPSQASLCWGFYHLQSEGRRSSRRRGETASVGSSGHTGIFGAGGTGEDGRVNRTSWATLRSIVSDRKTDKHRQALKVHLPGRAEASETRLFAFLMDHDSARNECLHHVQQALLYDGDDNRDDDPQGLMPLLSSEDI